MKKTTLILLSILFANFYTYGQGKVKFVIENFDDKQIGSSVVSWGAAQGKSGEIYIANTSGLFKYNGLNWTKCLNQKFISIAIDKEGIVYLGTQGDFGFLRSDLNGNPQFYSLKGKLDNLDLSSNIWKIIPTDDGVYFSSKEGIYKWDGATLKVWKSIKGQEYSTRFLSYDGDILTIKEGVGLIKLTEEGDSTIINNPNISNDKLFYFDKINNSYKIGLSQNGILTCTDTSSLVNFNPDTNEFFNKNRIFTEFLKEGENYFIGTQLGGIAVLDQQYNLVDSINEESGLIENSVRDLFIDSQQNLWGSLFQGATRIEITSPWVKYNQGIDFDGTPWSREIDIVDGTLILGTTKGMYTLRNSVFKKINFIKGRVWDIGTMNAVENGKIIAVASDQNLVFLNPQFGLLKSISIKASSILSSAKIKNKLIASATDGIYELDLANNYSAKMIYPYQNKDQVVFCSISDENGNIWIAARGVGLYKLTPKLNNDYDIELFDSKNGLDNDHNYTVSMTIINKTLYVGTNKGIYIYNKTKNTFQESNISKGSISTISAKNDSILYVSYYTNDGEQQIEKLHIQNDSVIKRSTDPFKKLKETNVIYILPSDSITWFSTSEGLFGYNEFDDKDYDIPFKTLISRTTSGDSLIFAGTYSTNVVPDKSIIVLDQPKEYEPTLDYDHNTIRFEYSATYFEDSEKNEFSYFLEGNDKSWSSWSRENVKEYNNLDPGSYTFYVKSKNIYDREGRTATYKFVILPPWYMTGWAYAFFTVCSGLFIWFVALAYTYRVRLQRRKLKLLVADRTFEVLSQKKEIEKQNQELKEQYEEIQQQRDAIDEKNQELEMSQEEILSINDKLQELNTSLEKKVDERTKEIKETVKKLQSSIAELDTFIYRASHDLKGPISRINGLTSLAKLETSSLNDIKYYNLIELVAKDMNKLLAKLTQVHEVINTEPELEWVDMPVLITEIRNSINFLDPDEKTKYSFVLESTLQVKSDAYLLSVILTNLMENALLFRNSSNKVNEVKISSGQDTDNFTISVEDNGIGIPKEHIDKVFNMFYRGSDQSKGSGLGLYLAQMAVEKLNGRIAVESEYGKYTKFTITLPKMTS